MIVCVCPRTYELVSGNTISLQWSGTSNVGHDGGRSNSHARSERAGDVVKVALSQPGVRTRCGWQRGITSSVHDDIVADGHRQPRRVCVLHLTAQTHWNPAEETVGL